MLLLSFEVILQRSNYCVTTPNGNGVYFVTIGRVYDFGILAVLRQSLVPNSAFARRLRYQTAAMLRNVSQAM